MGSQGEDIIMGKQTREVFPYSVECKNQEAVNVWKAYEQATENCKIQDPLVVIKRNRTKPLVLVDAEYFVKLHRSEDGKDNFSWNQVEENKGYIFSPFDRLYISAR